MQNSSFTMLIKRWVWVVLLGIVVCGGITFLISICMPPVYQANATLLISFGTSGSSYENTSASLEAVPTYAQIISSPHVLKPVLAQHRDLTLQQLDTMLSVQPITNTQLITLSVENTDPRMATELVYEICHSFEQFASAQLPISVQILSSSDPPTTPVRPRPLLNTMIGALAGLGVTIAVIVIFEWIDRLESLEQTQELLGMELLAVIARQIRSQFLSHLVEVPALAEKYRAICMRIHSAQTVSDFKLLMVTSPRPGEGKSMIATNIALFFAKAGKRVLLVDANVHKATLHKYFQLHNQVGFANVFEEHWHQPLTELYGQTTSVPGLQIMPAGKVPVHFSKLLRSPRAGKFMDQFKKAPFDYIIFDAPSLLSDADTSTLASLAQTTLVVVDGSRRSRKELKRTRDLLHKSDTSVLGVVINNSPWLEEKNLLLNSQSPTTLSTSSHTSSTPSQTAATDPSTQPTTERPTLSQSAIRQSRLFMQPFIKHAEDTLTSS